MKQKISRSPTLFWNTDKTSRAAIFNIKFRRTQQWRNARRDCMLNYELYVHSTKQLNFSSTAAAAAAAVELIVALAKRIIS